MSTSLVLYCKSYRTDLNRVVRLAKSVDRFNADKIPFYISVPTTDLHLFKEHLSGFQVTFIEDEQIICSNPKLNIEIIQLLPGNISQQIVKSEFWRMGVSDSYLCLDSDCIFIRPFRTADFIALNGTPYTIMDEGRDILFPALSLGKKQIISNFQRESTEVQRAFGRAGKHYNFGPNCPVWDRRVWQSLASEMLEPNKKNFLDLIQQSPNEMRWYGEALIRYRAIDILPTQPFFKMYHYAWQLTKDKGNGIGIPELTQLYCGVVYQSAWEREMDWPTEGGTWASRVGRRIRRKLGRM